MSEIKNREFLILSKSKELLLENVPRKDIYYKDKLKKYCYRYSAFLIY